MQVYISFGLMYAILFSIGALMPNRKFLSIYTLIVGFLTAYVLYDTYSVPEADRYDSPGAFFGIFIGIILAWGLWAGIITRVLTFVLKRYISWTYLRHLITFIGLLSMPMFFTAERLSHEWKFRPACNLDHLYFILAGKEIRLPALDIVLLDKSDNTGKIEDRLDDLFGTFSSPVGARKYCDKTWQGKKPLSVNSVSLLLESLPRIVQTDAYKKLCSDNHGGWLQESLCQIDNRKNIPFQISIFDNKHYDHNPYDKNFANAPSSYQWYTDHITEYEPESKYPSFYRGEKSKDVLWISNTIKVGDNNEPLAAICGFPENYLEDNLCTMTYQLFGDIYVEYSMKLPWENPDAEARKTFQEVNNFLEFIKLIEKDE